MIHESKTYIPKEFQEGRNREVWDDDTKKAAIVSNAFKNGSIKYLPQVLQDFSHWYTLEPIPPTITTLSFDVFNQYETRLFTDLAALNDKTPIANELRVKRKRHTQQTISRKVA